MLELTITAVAREVGVRPSTLRYYERIGLLPAALRVAGRRRYDVRALNQVQLIVYSKRAGFSLAQIRALQESASLGRPPALLWRELAARKATELDREIVRAQESKRRLFALSQCRCRNLAEPGVEVMKRLKGQIAYTAENRNALSFIRLFFYQKSH